MRWLTFTIFAYMAFVLEAGLHNLLQWRGVSPSWLLILGVFIGLSAPVPTTTWAMLILGMLADLLPGSPGILGPSALGYFVGGFAVVQLRGLVFRESPLALGVLTFVVGIFIHLTIVAVFSLRGVAFLTAEPLEGWNAANQLVHRFLSLLYTAVLAVPVGMLLFRFERAWGFSYPKMR